MFCRLLHKGHRDRDPALEEGSEPTPMLTLSCIMHLIFHCCCQCCGSGHRTVKKERGLVDKCRNTWKEKLEKKKPFSLLHTEKERSSHKEDGKRVAVNWSQVEADIKREEGGRVRKGGGKERAGYVIKAVITSFWNRFSQRALLERTFAGSDGSKMASAVCSLALSRRYWSRRLYVSLILLHGQLHIYTQNEMFDSRRAI